MEKIDNMRYDELFSYTFKALRHRLGHDRPKDQRPLWQRRLSADSDFCRAVVACGYLSREQMLRTVSRYRLGRSRDGGVIFWQIDTLDTVCDGKIMHYRPDCHRDHSRHPDWVMSAMKRYYLRGEEALQAMLPSVHCLFGTHLLRDDHDSPVAVVEAEKTAVILSEHYPHYLWLAAGGLYELTAVKLFPLRGRRIILFPDTDPDGKAYALWYRVMTEARRLLGQPVAISPLLELQATPVQKAAKIDLADYWFEASKRGV